MMREGAAVRGEPARWPDEAAARAEMVHWPDEAAWPWEHLPGGRWVGRVALGGLALLWAWALASWPLTRAGALLVGVVVAVGILLRPALGFPLLAIAIPFGSLRSLNIGPAAIGPEEVLLGAIGAAWLARRMAHRRLDLRWPASAGAGLLLLAVMLVSFLPATSLVLATKELVKWMELWLAMVLVVNLAGAPDLGLLALGLLAAGAAEAAVGLRQALTGSGPAGFLLGSFMRAAGTFGQPNPYGGYLGMTLPLAVGLVLTAWPGKAEGPSRRYLQVLWGAAAAGGILMAVGLFVSMSRGAWLGAAVAVAAVIVARGGAWLRGVAAGGILAVALSLLVWGRVPIPGALEQRLADYAADLTTLDVRAVEVTDANFALVERVAHWQAAWAMFSDHPWTGVGIGNYAEAYARYALPRWQDPLGHAHNYFLNILAEAGLGGLAAYLLWAAASLWLVVQAVRGSQGWLQGLALGALGMWVHLNVHSLFDNLYVHGMAIQVGLFLGLAAWIVAERVTGRQLATGIE